MKRIALVALFCLLAALLSEANAQSKLDLSFRNVPLKTVMNTIEKQTDCRFVYSANLIDVSQKVTIITKGELKDVLTKLFSDNGIVFLIKGKQIILSPKENSKSPSDVIVTGVVSDETGAPCPFVSIYPEGFEKSVIMSGSDGHYKIKAPLNSTLCFVMTGYDTKKIKIIRGGQQNVQLAQSARQLNEVEVVGFGEQKRATISASVASIKAAEIIQSPVANISNALSGRLPGLTTVQYSGQPGDDASRLFIRGRGSWTDNTPLYVIDGVERSSAIFSTMDPSEIESFSLLKDAAATAVYGSKGANGVILIKSKRGVAGKTSISVNLSTTVQQFTRYPKYLNSYESLKLFNEAMVNDGKDPVYSDEELEHYRLQDDPYRYPDTDWYKLMMKKYAPQYNASINIRGGSKSVLYFISGSYMRQEGILRTAQGRIYNPEFSYQRYRFSSNVDAFLTKNFTLSLEMGGSLSDRKDPYSQLDVFTWMNRLPPWVMPATNPDGSYSGTAEYNTANPVYMLNTQGSDTRIRNSVTSAIKMKFGLGGLLKGLSAETRLAFDSNFGNGKYWKETQSTYRLVSRYGRADRYVRYNDPVFFSPSEAGNEDVNKSVDFLASLRYANDFGAHSVSAQIFSNISSYKVGSYEPYNSVNFIGRVNYSYKEKYFMEMNASYRGSENFAPDKRFGFFPSMSAGWNIHEERFMRKAPVIDILKLTASYGISGSDYASTRFLYKQGKWETATSGGALFGPGGGKSQGYSSEPNIADPDATWETAKQTNVRLELSMFKNRFYTTFDRFFEHRDGILQVPYSIPSVLGIGFSERNIGKTTRNGWELESSWYDRIGSNFKYYIRGNLAFVTNKVVFKDEAANMESWRKEEGKPIGQFFGYVVEGFFNSQEEIDHAPLQLVGTPPIPGDLRYMDFDGNGVIDEYDKVPIGRTIMPRYTYGLSFGASYSGFEVNVHFQGASQSSVFLQDYLMYEFYNRGKVQDIHKGRWTPETKESATYPALHIGAQSQNHNVNTFFLKNNAYLRLKTLEIAYTYSGSYIKKLGVKGLRFYLSGVNLLTWDSLKVVDPETPNGASGSIYPQSRNYSLGVNINF